MRRYAFEAVDGSGSRASGVRIALNEAELDRALRDRGLTMLRSRSVSAPRRVSGRVIIDFFYHLAVLDEAGVALVSGLRDLQEDGSHPLAVELAEIGRRIEAGTTLSEALAVYPRYFSPLAVSVVKAGEKTGRLDRVLRDLVRYLEWREDLVRQIRSATTYPIIVLSALFGLCTILGLFVLPRFIAVFAELGVELPLPMKIILFTRDFLIANWPWVLLGVAVVGLTLWMCGRSEPGRRMIDRAVLRLPLLGRLAVSLDMSRLCQNLGLLYGAGLPILASLSVTAEIVQNRVIRDAVHAANDSVQRGSTLVDALRPAGVVPAMVLRMLQVGESTGRLDESLARVASFYEREVPEVIQRAIALFNSAVLVFLGAVLVVIALSFFIPMYEGLGNLNAH